MGVLRNIGYLLAAIAVVAILCVGGAIISAVVIILGALLVGGAVVSFIAFVIKEYCENATDRPSEGEHGRTQKESS